MGPEQAVPLGQGGHLPAKFGVGVYEIEHVPARREQVDLVRGDQGPQLRRARADDLDGLPVALGRGVQRQVAAGHADAAEAKVLGPGREDAHDGRFARRHADEGEGAGGGGAVRGWC